MDFAASLHSLAGLVWVGGWFFLYVVLQGAVEEVLEPTERLPLMERVLQRFLPWADWSLGLLWLSGYWLLPAAGGVLAVEVTLVIGGLSTILFLYLRLFLYRRLRRALADCDLPLASSCLGRALGLIGVNLVLALLAVLVGSLMPVSA